MYEMPGADQTGQAFKCERKQSVMRETEVKMPAELLLCRLSQYVAPTTWKSPGSTTVYSSCQMGIPDGNDCLLETDGLLNLR